MAYETLVDKAKTLPESILTEVLHYMMYLESQSEERKEEKKPKRQLGTLAGGLFYMADDFDETPEGFEEYM